MTTTAFSFRADRHSQCVGVGHWIVRFDSRCFEGKGLIARVDLKRKDFELSDNSPCESMAVLAGEPVVHLQVDHAQQQGSVPPASLSKKRLYAFCARLILNPGEDGEGIEQTSFPHAADPPCGRLTGTL